MGDCKTCTGCKNSKTKAEEPLTISYSAYQMAQANNRKNIRNIIIALIVAIVMIFGTNLAWLLVWNSYEFYGEETIVELDSNDGGNANYIGNNGDINNGTSASGENIEETR